MQMVGLEQVKIGAGCELSILVFRPFGRYSEIGTIMGWGTRLSATPVNRAIRSSDADAVMA